MRVALAVKLRVRRATLDDAAVSRIAREACEDTGVTVIDAAFVRAVANPPRGRLGVVVLERVASEHGATVGAVRAVIAHTHRPRGSQDIDAGDGS
jgi:hypothetical protein